MKKIIMFLMFISCFFITGCDNTKEDLKSGTSKSKIEEKKESNQESDSKNETVKEELILKESEIKENNIIKEDVVMNNEEEVVTYFKSIEQEVDNTTKLESLSKSASQKLKNTFITIADFLFYDGKIGNVTFNELSEETKVKVLEIAGRIDSKIENKLPGYKETIKTTSGKVYNTVSDKIKSGISSINEYMKTHMEENTYNSLQEGASDMKESFGKAADSVIEAGKNVKDKIKDWYENFRK